MIDLPLDEGRSQLDGSTPDIPGGRLTVIGLGSTIESIEGGASTLQNTGGDGQTPPVRWGLLGTGQLEREGRVDTAATLSATT